MKTHILNLILVAVYLAAPAIMARDKNAALKKQREYLAGVSFDQVVLYTLIAAEQNYKVKERLAPRVHQNDYYTVILNTAKRLAMSDSSRITLPGLQTAKPPDSTKTKKE